MQAIGLGFPLYIYIYETSPKVNKLRISYIYIYISIWSVAQSPRLGQTLAKPQQGPWFFYMEGFQRLYTKPWTVGLRFR